MESPGPFFGAYLFEMGHLALKIENPSPLFGVRLFEMEHFAAGFSCKVDCDKL